MAEQITVKTRSVDGGTLVGPLWLGGWLFSLGFLRLTFWKGVLALFVWPYFLGAFFHK